MTSINFIEIEFNSNPLNLNNCLTHHDIICRMLDLSSLLLLHSKNKTKRHAKNNRTYRTGQVC